MIRSEQCLPGTLPASKMDMSPTTKGIMQQTQIEADEKIALEMARELEQLQAEAVELEQMKILQDLEMEELELQNLLQQQKALDLRRAAASAGLIVPKGDSCAPEGLGVVATAQATAAANPEVRGTPAVNPEVRATAANPEVTAATAVNPEVRATAANPEVLATKAVNPEVPATAAVNPEVEVLATEAVNPEVPATAAVNPEVQASVAKVELAAPASTVITSAFAAQTKIHVGTVGLAVHAVSIDRSYIAGFHGRH